MTLTDRESRWLARNRKYQRWWPYTRWLGVLISVGLGVLHVTMLYWLAGLAEEEQTVGSAMLFGYLAPICWLMLFVASWFLGFVLANWNGDIKTRLLFRLLDEHEEQNAEQSAPGERRSTSRQ